VRESVDMASAVTSLIGKGADCDLVLPNRFVSRRHARIERRGDSYLLTDLGSLNGTLVKGRRIEASHELQHADKFDIGDYRLTFLNQEIPTERQVPAIDALRIDRDSLDVSLGLKQLDVHLRPQEVRLLIYLQESRGRVVGTAEIGNHIWGSVVLDGKPLAQYDMNSVHQLVSRLKRALRSEIDTDRYIITVPGIGYRFEEHPT
jgi:pSer/pThr/pTyr-binding forkhead associated (FHA) protein